MQKRTTALCRLLSALVIGLILAALFLSGTALTNRSVPRKARGTFSAPAGTPLKKLSHSESAPSLPELSLPSDSGQTTDDLQIGGKESGITNVLLIGQDRREGSSGARSDTMILCTLRPEDQTIILTSFLRDLYVPIPGHGSDRLNAAYAYGGTELLQHTLEENFALVLDGCVELDFSGFAGIIDLLGGVTLELRQDEANAVNKVAPGNLTEGTNLLSGEQALAYARIRKLDADGDFSRTNRQRKVLTSLLNSYKNADIKTLLAVLPKAIPLLSTDMDYSGLFSTAVKLLPILRSCTIVSQSVPVEGSFQYRTIRGMSVLTADAADIRKFLRSSLLKIS